MTYYVETCRPDIYTIVYKINVVLLTDVQYLFEQIINPFIHLKGKTKRKLKPTTIMNVKIHVLFIVYRPETSRYTNGAPFTCTVLVGS